VGCSSLTPLRVIELIRVATVHEEGRAGPGAPSVPRRTWALAEYLAELALANFEEVGPHRSCSCIWWGMPRAASHFRWAATPPQPLCTVAPFSMT
jgi:hypothetical protein